MSVPLRERLNERGRVRGRCRSHDRGRDRGRGQDRDRDRGQVTIEFLGMTPTIIVTLIALWQVVLVGYTFTLAGNAADEAVRAGTAAEPGARQAACEAAGLEHLSEAWRSGAAVTCGGSGYVTADVRLEVPILFPGTLSFPYAVKGHAGAVEEAD